MNIKGDKGLYTSHDVHSILAMKDRVDSLHFFTSYSPNEINEYFSNTPHILNSLTIGLCISGSAKVKLNLSEQELVANHLIFLLPHTIVDPIEVSKNFRLHSIVFDFDFIASMPLLHSLYMNNEIRQRPILKLDSNEFTLIESLSILINKYYYRNEQENTPEVISHLLSALLSEVNRLFLLQTSLHKVSRANSLTNSFLTLLQNNYREEREVSYYANKLNITPKYLTTVVRQETNKPISIWISEFVIAYAKSLLKSTDKTITQIAEELNFAESTLFARYFKRYTKMTPSDFRKG